MDHLTPHGFHMDILLESDILRIPKMHLKSFFSERNLCGSGHCVYIVKVL